MAMSIISRDFKKDSLMLFAKSGKIDNMDNGRDRTVNEELFLWVDIHISDCPGDLLRFDVRNLLPVIGILRVEQNDVRLTGTVVIISATCEPSTVDSSVRDHMLSVQFCGNHVLINILSLHLVLRRWCLN